MPLHNMSNRPVVILGQGKYEFLDTYPRSYWEAQAARSEYQYHQAVAANGGIENKEAIEHAIQAAHAYAIASGMVKGIKDYDGWMHKDYSLVEGTAAAEREFGLFFL